MSGRGSHRGELEATGPMSDDRRQLSRIGLCLSLVHWWKIFLNV